MGHSGLLDVSAGCQSIRTGHPLACPCAAFYDGTSPRQPALDPVLTTLEGPAQGCRDLDSTSIGTQGSTRLLLQTVNPPVLDMPNVCRMKPSQLVEVLANQRTPFRRALARCGRAFPERAGQDLLHRAGILRRRDCRAALRRNMAFVPSRPSVEPVQPGPSGPSTATGKASIDWLDGLGVIAKRAWAVGGVTRTIRDAAPGGFPDRQFSGRPARACKQIKKRYDPHNMFWFEQSLRPKPRAACRKRP